MVLCDSRRVLVLSFFFFNDTATTEIYTLSLHDALPILPPLRDLDQLHAVVLRGVRLADLARSEEHTSELQSLAYLVCRLLLEKKKKTITTWSPLWSASTSVELAVTKNTQIDIVTPAQVD